jgi:hypothetical protein
MVLICPAFWRSLQEQRPDCQIANKKNVLWNVRFVVPCMCAIHGPVLLLNGPVPLTSEGGAGEVPVMSAVALLSSHSPFMPASNNCTLFL